MDDGLQFAEKFERKVSYRAVATRFYGKEKLNYSIPTWDLETAKADMAKMAERKVSERDRQHVDTDFVYENLYIEVTELDGSVHPLVEEVEATPETSEIVEQSVEASTASTDAEITVQASDTVKVEAACRMYGSSEIRRHVVYSGTSVLEAKAAYKEYRENPSHGTSLVMMYHKIDGCWLASSKYHFNRHDEWLKDFHAGKFDAAYMRDYLNDLAVSPEARRRDAMVNLEMEVEAARQERMGNG